MFSSKYGKVRIWQVLSVSKESKEWAANPANRLCDAPGSWYCPGQYPPKLAWLEKKKKAFKQLEDFNQKRDKRDDKYYEEYMSRMDGKHTGQAASGAASFKTQMTEAVDKVKRLIKQKDEDKLAALLVTQPEVVHLRTSDGRGPLWWAYEAGHLEIANLLLAAGADPNAVDKGGLRPFDLKR